MVYTTLWRSNLNQCFATCAVHYAVKIRSDVHFVAFWLMLDQSSMIRMLSYHASLIQRYFLFNWRPPTLPCRLQHSTIGRSGLNHRVRDGNGCVPWAHRHPEGFWKLDSLLSQSYHLDSFPSSRCRTFVLYPKHITTCLLCEHRTAFHGFVCTTHWITKQLSTCLP